MHSLGHAVELGSTLRDRSVCCFGQIEPRKGGKLMKGA